MVDYRQWRAGVLDCHTNGVVYDDWWQLPDGRLLHVMGEQRHDGGVTFLYDDASERLALEGKYNALIDVQRETLDSMKEGVAVFATDGRLKLFNSAFLSIWKLSRETLDQGPHIDEIIALSRPLFDDAATWSRLSRAVTAVNPPTENSRGIRLGNYLQIQNVWNEELEAIWGGTKTAKQALAAMDQRGNVLLRQFQADNK